ncbi:CLUMA_CG001007, isoform A [Clunio marinus]|uniref:CLUMA_CG001007, isoform A n=1 Tax=Clunio marinus TaxID=568069 RepID=A0A1J1HH43_9DIPT|nr:CLUMA_CG001007, isoform A [Clunio marinus]
MEYNKEKANLILELKHNNNGKSSLTTTDSKKILLPNIISKFRKHKEHIKYSLTIAGRSYRSARRGETMKTGSKLQGTTKTTRIR